MADVELTDLDAVLIELAYPLDRSEAVEALSGTTLVYEGGETPLDEVVDRSSEEIFFTPADLEAEVFANVHADEEAVVDPDDPGVDQ